MLTQRLLGVVRRRWYVVVVGLLATAALMSGVAFLLAPRSTVTATVLLLPPATPLPNGPGKSNPYLQLGGLTSPVEVVARALNDPVNRERVLSGELDGDYVAERDLSTSAPVLLLTSEAATLQQARDIRDDLLDLTPRVLAQLQTSIGVPPSSQLTSAVLSEEGLLEASNKARIRAAVLAAAVGGSGTLVLAAALDVILIRRARRSAKPDEDESDPVRVTGERVTGESVHGESFGPPDRAPATRVASGPPGG